MDLIDRYLVAVRRNLPRPLQRDVVEELSDSLRSEAEDQEQHTGRPITAEEQAALLKKRGHPWLLASRYLPQQQLIGPALFPYYRQALAIVLFWVVLPVAIGGGALAAIYSPDSGRAWGHALGAAWNGAIYAIGIVTIVFSVLESQHVRITALDNWNPATLPEPQDGRAIPRGESLFNLIISITFLVLWTDIVRLPEFADYSGTPVRFVPEPIWASVYLPILVSLLVTIATSFVDLMRPWRTLLFSGVRVVTGLANVVIVGVLLRADRWVTVMADPESADKAARADYWINRSLEWTLIIVGAIVLFDVLQEVWRTIKARREAVA